MIDRLFRALTDRGFWTSATPLLTLLLTQCFRINSDTAIKWIGAVQLACLGIDIRSAKPANPLDPQPSSGSTTMKSLLLIVASVLALALTGCAAQTTANGAKPTPCDQIRAVYNGINATVTSADNVVASQEAVLATLPANDPIRKQLEPALAKAQAYAAEVQVGLALARAGVAALCPELPQTPPATQSVAPGK